MIVGVLSDTHGYFHPRLVEALAGSDVIVHAGDVGTPDILDRLEALAPLHAVYGNIDGQAIRKRVPETNRFVVDELSFLVTHIAGRPGKWSAGIKTLLQDVHPDVFICGHSHILRVERDADLGNMLFVNPGAAGRQGLHQVKTVVRLHTVDGRLKEAEVVHLDEE